MASSSLSSSSITSHRKYDVFLSFRGEDTRNTFTSHLYAALCRKKIETFIDDDGLKRGDEISPVLLKAIEESKISVIIFSKDYGSSRWCLDELAKILECKETNQQMVIPVFYHVNPTDIRKQTGSFEAAFVKHEERFQEMPGKVQKWRAALTEAANLSGWDSLVIKPEAKLVEEIVKDILMKLNKISASSDFKGLVGISSRIERIESLLCIGLLDFRIIGIWGMGGIGKTTIAGAIFNRFHGHFEGCCFSINVRENSEKFGLVHLRDQVLSQILDDENLKLGTPIIPKYIQDRLQRKRVFIVLDDVNNVEQLEVLAGGFDRFCPGSRIIITTRDKQLLSNVGVDNYIYEVEGFNYHEALQLFCDHAFRKSHPYESFVKLSNKIVDYAKGNPLALKVLGSSLHGKSKKIWESALSNLKKICDPKIHDLLKISYDGLNGDEKSIFLDIACFFKGLSINYVTKMLEDCYDSLDFALSNLKDKSLITILDSKVEMHDLLQDMGREIVCKESIKEPGKRSRLWYHEDIYHVLKKNTGTDVVEGISLDMSKIRDVNLSNRAFVKMANLRLLKFYFGSPNIPRVHLPQGIKYLPDELRSLHWSGYPLKTLPSKFSFENLVELELPDSSIEQLWEGKKHASKLKFIDVCNSQNLTKIPNLSYAPNLERINLGYCKSLLEVSSSIKYLNSLCSLNLNGCENLRSFPSNIQFRSPISLSLVGCINITQFPHISGNIKELYIGGTTIEEVPSSIECLTVLGVLNLAGCTRLKSVSTNICKLKSLHEFSLWNCSRLESFPEILEKMECLEDLILDGTALKELPSSIGHLHRLSALHMKDCKNLEILPSSIYDLSSLSNVDLSGCSKLNKLPKNVGNVTYLDKLEENGSATSQLPSSITDWKEISVLDLSFCNLIEIPEDLCCLSSLKTLKLSGNKFESLPTSIKQLSQLASLFINDCTMLQLLPELPLCLEYLQAMNCKRLQTIPEPPSSPEKFDLEGYSLCFVFANCLNLNEKAYDNILADSQLKFQLLNCLLENDESLRFCYEKAPTESAAISLCLPGSEIPKWFSYQSAGSSITIVLPQHWCNGSFIGFALCVVFAFEQVYDDANFYFQCNYHFENCDAEIKYFGCELNVTGGNWDNALIESEHMLMGYTPSMGARHLDGDCTKASFEFTPIKYLSDDPPKDCKVKCCAVCPLYTQPNVTLQPSEESDEKLATINQDFGEPMVIEPVEVNTGGSGYSFDEEEVEPDPKRICRNKINNKEQ